VIHRPDWSSQGGDRALVNTCLPGVTTGGSGNVVAADAGHLVPAAVEGGETSLSDAVIERGGIIGDRLLEDCPDPVRLEWELQRLPQEDIDLLFSVMANLKANEDVYDLVTNYERKATIPQVLRAKALFQQLPDELREWILSHQWEQD
jgi:hypothetical protein